MFRLEHRNMYPKNSISMVIFTYMLKFTMKIHRLNVGPGVEKISPYFRRMAHGVATSTNPEVWRREFGPWENLAEGPEFFWQPDWLPFVPSHFSWGFAVRYWGISKGMMHPPNLRWVNRKSSNYCMGPENYSLKTSFESNLISLCQQATCFRWSMFNFTLKAPIACRRPMYFRPFIRRYNSTYDDRLGAHCWSIHP